MNMHRTHPIDYVQRRLSSLLIVVAAVVGIVALTAAELVGLPRGLALAIGLGAFLVLSVLVSDVSTRLAHRAADDR